MDATRKSEGQFLTGDDLVVGQTFCSGSRQLDAAEITAFARQYDPQPFHLDDEAAKETLFAGLAASGWQTAGITMRLLVESVPILGGIVGVEVEAKWPRPTRPGDVLHVESEVLEIVPSRSRPDRGMVTIRSVTINQEGQAVQTLVSKLVVPRRRKNDDVE